MSDDLIAELEATWEAGLEPVYSISQIEGYLRCPRRWYYRYRLGLPDPPGPEAEWGTAFHAAVEAYYTGQPMPVLSEDLAQAWTVYHTAIARHVVPLPGWTERWITFRLAGALFRGRIDVVDQQLTVRDTKTRRRRPSQEDVNDSLQLTAYYAGVQQTLGEWPKAVAWDCLIRNKQPVAETYLADRTPADVDHLQRVVDRVLNAIAKEIFVPAWGCLGCVSCPFRARCRTE